MASLKRNTPTKKPNPVFLLQIAFLIVFIVFLAVLAFAEPSTNGLIGGF